MLLEFPCHPSLHCIDDFNHVVSEVYEICSDISLCHVRQAKGLVLFAIVLSGVTLEPIFYCSVFMWKDFVVCWLFLIQYISSLAYLQSSNGTRAKCFPEQVYWNVKSDWPALDIDFSNKIQPWRGDLELRSSSLLYSKCALDISGYPW